MLKREYLWVAIAILLMKISCGEVSLAEEQGHLNRPQFQVRVSKTAIWVGDELEYKVAVNHSRDIELVTENLKKEGINLEPFKIPDGKIEVRELSAKRQLTIITFLLTCYEIGKGEIKIPSWNIYYTQRRSPLQTGKSPVEYFTVPAINIGLGSTLTRNSRSIRDFKPIEELGLADRLIPLPGIIAVVMLIAIGSRWAVVRFRAGISKQKKISRRFLEKGIISSLDGIECTNFHAPEEVIQSYSQLNKIIYEFIRYWTGTDMAGLTPEEVNIELIRQGNDKNQAESIKDILDRCQVVRYHPYSQGNDKGAIEKDLEEAKGVILKAFQQ